MTPVHLKPGVGNCLAACIASMLDLSLAQVFDVPGGGSNSNYWTIVDGWLAARGLELVHVIVPPGHRVRGDAYYIAVGPPARGLQETNASHAVIYQHGELAHDPVPSTGGLAIVEEILFLVPQQRTQAPRRESRPQRTRKNGPLHIWGRG